MLKISGKKIGFWLGLGLFVALLAAPIDAGNAAASRMAAVAALMGAWWITEAIPIPVTALLPVALFPILKIMKGSAVSELYFNTYIFLFTGGFVLALALEKWNLHRRMALSIVRVIGGKPETIVLGFMCATGFISMWISNTATAMMMLPIAMSVIAVMRPEAEGLSGAPNISGAPVGYRNFATGLMLSVAYAASIGGMATLIGTPPNLLLIQVYEIEFPGAAPISFAQWMMMATPLAVVFLLVTWVLLAYVLFPAGRETLLKGREVIRHELQKLGRMRPAEMRVLFIFSATVLLWIFRGGDAKSGGLTGWSDRLGLAGWVDDGTVAVAMALLLFLIPSGESKGGALMDWATAVRLPWGILFLFGGGFALAGGFESSGLSAWIGEGLKGLAGFPPIILTGAVCTTVTFLSEMTSNTATAGAVLPIVAAVAKAIQVHPLSLMIPATLSASLGFMLPVATPPNAIVFGSGHVTIQQMAKAGLALNLIGIVLVTATTFLLALPLFGGG
ncbi:MAG: DASS family sodium-coupled anion symporter [bacterium]